LSTKISIQRTQNYFKQLKGSFIFKLLAILSSFLMIPIMIKYLGNEQYGIWSTILSIVSWIVLFDIGIGNGLRNKIAESLVKDDKKEAQNYISTAYTIIGLISIVLLSIILLFSNYISWQVVFNTQSLSNDELTKIINVVFSFIFINFWISLINQVFNGIQKTSLVVFNQFLSNFLALMLIYLLYRYIETSLLYVAFVYGGSLVLSSLILSVWFYNRNKNLLPRFKDSSLKMISSITSLGSKFFIIQIAVVVIFTTDKILITQLFGPEYVTQYDVIFKLFAIITILHGILMAPLWSAYSDAYHREDYEWIRNTIKQQLKIWILIVVATMFLILISPYIIEIWIGKDYIINNNLIYTIAGFVIISTWNNIFAYFLNAINILKLQINTSLVAMIINIPLSIIFIKYFELGIYGIVMATILSLSIFAIFGSLKVFKILKANKNVKMKNIFINNRKENNDK
jgi:O-antigen/teichoic acid export membrane protein